MGTSMAGAVLRIAICHAERSEAAGLKAEIGPFASLRVTRSAQSNPRHQIGEPGIPAERLVSWVHVQVNQAGGAGLEGALERREGLVELPHSRIAHGQNLGPDVLTLGLLFQPGENLFRLV